ncbi:hypothetical protein [Amycolatopsis sp. lyj-112]|uniref:hypothetical protein n=1 Tax=Amycolatopsis sp. lyj-112 TaxID=2789288 RepID=UPI00397E1666
MSTHEHQRIEIALQPKPLPLARYILSPTGHLAQCETLPPLNRHSLVTLADPAALRQPVNYDSDTARDAAAHLLGYAHEFSTWKPLPASISIPLLEADTRTVSTSTWNLMPGLVLTYRTPFEAVLESDIDEWTLTPALATRWARALLTLAAELDHANAVAAHAVLANRGGTRSTDNIRGWLHRMTEDDVTNEDWFFHALRDVLGTEDNIVRDGTLTAALNLANPDEPTSLTDLLLLPAGTITHLDAATVIKRLAIHYGLPLYLWTAENWYLATHIGEPPLTEQEWLRFSRTAELDNFGLMIEQLQRDGTGLDFQLALVQAGLLCRQCDCRITGDIADTFGHCTDCLPPDRDTALAVALERGCPVEPFDEGISSHDGDPGDPCSVCGLPLPQAD